MFTFLARLTMAAAKEEKIPCVTISLPGLALSNIERAVSESEKMVWQSINKGVAVQCREEWDLEVSPQNVKWKQINK